MAQKQYAYYIRGRDLAIIENDISQVSDGSTAVDSEWGSPKSTVADGLYIEYVAIPKAKDGGELLDESDEIDLNDLYTRALVYYLKARVAEDNKDMKLREYFMREFYRILNIGKDSKIHTIRKIAGSM